MARVLYVWELGGGLGHIGRAAPIIEGLRVAGHEIWVALRDLSGATTMLRSLDVRLVQCPLWLPQLRGLPDSATYAELLLRAGFGHPTGLEGLTRAWRELFRLVQPALMIADHAPNAFLAARGERFRRALIGNGFFSPPRVSPLPSFRTWDNIPAGRIASADAHVLGVANTVLASLGMRPFERLCDLLDVDEDFLCTWPELDHYRGRVGQRYWGPTTERERGEAPTWPDGREPRVFAYLKVDSEALEPVLVALSQAKVRSLLYVPGIPAERVRSLPAERMRFSVKPVRMGEATAQADVLVCNAGEGTVGASMLAGTPVLALPMHAEQYITSLVVEREGFGLNGAAATTPAAMKSLLNRLLTETRFRDAARRVAGRYEGFVPEEASSRIVARCEELIAAGPREPA